MIVSKRQMHHGFMAGRRNLGKPCRRPAGQRRPSRVTTGTKKAVRKNATRRAAREKRSGGRFHSSIAFAKVLPESAFGSAVAVARGGSHPLQEFKDIAKYL